MSILYVEAFSGLSGDMFLGGLAGLANAYDELEQLPQLLQLPDARVEIQEVDKNGIVCKHVKVIDLNEKDDHDHHHHKHDHNHHHHPHRHLREIIKIIDQAAISEGAKKIANEIFHIIGTSESNIHNIPLEKIHFHEISAVDSLVDIIGCAVLLDKLKISQTFSTAVCTGHGFVNTQHGKLPVPAPATADILQGIPTYAGDEAGERTTPTGAAILKYLNPSFSVPVLTTIKKAYGPGQKTFIAPNVVRLSICEVQPVPESLFMLETNIDDMSGEFLGIDFQNNLLKHGAIDFYFTAVQMKKGRAGQLLSCIVDNAELQRLSDFILEHTSSIGVRYYKIDRHVLQREIKEIDTPFGKVKVKTVVTPSGAKRASIEYENLKLLSENNNLSMQALHDKITPLIN